MSDALDAFLDEEPTEEEIPSYLLESDYWVRDLLTADKAMGRVAKIDHRINEIVDAANAKIERIEQWRTDECDRLKSKRAYYEQLLAHFHASVLDNDPKQKTIRVSNGVLQARKQPDNVDIPDPLATLAWCIELSRDDLFRVKRELNRTEIKHAVLKNGEIIRGVEIVPGEVRYSVAPNN